MNDPLQPRGASREGGQDTGREALGEDLPPTGNCVAPEASYDDLELDAPATDRQVGGKAPIVALDAARRGPAV